MLQFYQFNPLLFNLFTADLERYLAAVTTLASKANNAIFSLIKTPMHICQQFSIPFWHQVPQTYPSFLPKVCMSTSARMWNQIDSLFYLKYTQYPGKNISIAILDVPNRCPTVSKMLMASPVVLNNILFLILANTFKKRKGLGYMELLHTVQNYNNQ